MKSLKLFLNNTRGFTLLLAVILVSAILGVSITLFDITYKQVLLSNAAQQSNIAFYNADSALECAIFQDQQQLAFDYVSEPASGAIANACQGTTINYSATAPTGGLRTTTFSIPCDSNPQDASSTVTIVKQSTGATVIYAEGYNTCDHTDPRRIERGEKVNY